jgi:hypothetical protein
MKLQSSGSSRDPAATVPLPTGDAGPKAVARAERLNFWLAVVIVAVIFAGGLFGYDQGVISRHWAPNACRPGD